MSLTVPAAHLTTRLAASAREFAHRLGELAKAGRTSEPDDPKAGHSMAGWLHAPILPRPPEADVWDKIIADHAAMAEAGDWQQLLPAIRRADHDRAEAPGGLRVAPLMARGARGRLTKAIAEADWDGAEAEIDRLTSVMAAFPGCYSTTHILAQAHLDLGWARRSATAETGNGRDGWKEFLAHTAKAEDILEIHDPIEEDSPLLAATRYQLVRGIEEGETLFRDWYEDWCDLDPSSAEPHAMHAVLMLPQWYGTMAEFDAEARAAADRTEDISGAAAYAVFYLSAAQVTGDAPAQLDLDLYLHGLGDYHRATGCQYRANIVANALAELAHAYAIDGTPGSPQAAATLQALDRFLRQHLREFHLTAWEGGEAVIHWAVGQVFAAELEQGAHVFAGPAGLEARQV